MESRDVFELSVTKEQNEAAISLIVANNCCNHQDEALVVPSENPQEGNSNFNCDNDIIKADISDLSTCYDEDLS